VVIHSPVQVENGRRNGGLASGTHNILKGLTVFPENCQGQATAFCTGNPVSLTTEIPLDINI
jgi:hypothetical protein